jgi:hypothetical protein
MTTRDAETLAQLVAERAGKGRPDTFEELANRSVDPETGYKPSANLVWKISTGENVKINPPLIRALAAGMRLHPDRVGDAAHRQFIRGWSSGQPPFETGSEDDDAVYRVAVAAGATPDQMPAVKEFFDMLRKERDEADE